MKKQLFILLLFFMNAWVACYAVDPLPGFAVIKIDPEIRKNGASISFIEDGPPVKGIQADGRTQLIKPGKESYHFELPGESFRVKIQFTDSTKKLTPFIKRAAYHATYTLGIGSDHNLVISDITDDLRSASLLKYIAFVSLIFLMIKILPTWIIFFPKDIATFLKYYGLAQCSIALICSMLIFFVDVLGVPISIIVMFAAIYVDKKILNKIYRDSHKALRIKASITLTIMLTIFFSLFQLVAFMLMIPV